MNRRCAHLPGLPGLLFTVVLLVGLAWAWAHGDLEWIKKLSERPRSAEEAGREKVSLSA